MSGVSEQVTTSELVDRMDRLEEQNKELQQELQAEKERRQDLERIIEIRGAEDPGEADLSHVWIAGNPAGKFIADNKAHRKKSQSVLFGVDGGFPRDGPALTDIKDQMASASTVYESVDDSVSSGQSRDLPFPLYRMLVDVRDGQDSALGDNEKRAAELFDQFVSKAKGDEGPHNVTPNKEYYLMNTEQATDTLAGEGLLDDVSESSYSKLTGRAMREVQRYSIVDEEEHEDCNNIEECSEHGLVQFKPGNPRKLRVSKKRLKAVIANTSRSDNDVRTTDDGVSVENTPEEGSDKDVSQGQSEVTAVTSDD